MADLFDIAIIGGGPAGQAAAERTLAAGLSTCMIDEQQRPGGQILRQPPAQYRVPGWMKGRLYRDLRDQLERTAKQEKLDWIGGTSVAGLWREDDHFRLSLSGQRNGDLHARRVLVATGCYDMPVPLPGWTLPGVLSAGGLQTLLKGQQLTPGSDILLFGTHPLMLVLAEQLLAAGIMVRGVLFAQPFSHLLRLMPAHALAALRAPAPLLAAAGSWKILRRAGVPILFDAQVTALIADEGGATLAAADVTCHSAQRRIACDIAAMCFGFLPQSDLTRAAGADMRWSDPAGGWETGHDPWMRSSVPGLYVAGETGGVAGADAALLDGAIAGLAMAVDAGAIPADVGRRDVDALLRRRARLQPFIDLLRAVADPRDWLPTTTADTLICRCEDVTAETVDRAITEAMELGSDFGASAIKLRCRAGMGLCQGRSCEHGVMRRITAATGTPLPAISGFRARYPVRAIPIDDLIAPD
jgi:thioredoxin reductase